MPAFETEQLTVRDLFSEDYVFRFPPYQRPYRWNDEHAEALFNDLVAAMGTEGAVDDVPPYFVGSIVLVGKLGNRDRLVIDGRQRLTTIAMLIAALRDIERRPDLKDALHEMLYDAEAPVAGIKRGPRLVIDGVDGKGMLDWVLEKGATARSPEVDEDLPERVERVVEVVALFRRKLTALDDSVRIRLRDFLVRRCELVAVVTPDEDQGLRIFKVLNTRGLPLSVVDLIKPDLLTPLPAEQREEAIECWEQAETILGGKDMSRLLRALSVIYLRAIPPEDTRLFHEQFIKGAKQRGVDKVCLEDIKAYAELLSQIDEGEIPCSDMTRDPNIAIKALTWLGWDSEDWLPLAIEIIMKGGEDEDKIYRWLRGLERVCYSFFVLRSNERAGREDRREAFLKALQDLAVGRDPTRDDGPLALSPETRRRMIDALQRPIDASYQRRALLQRIEAAKSQRGLHPKIDEASLEHILPMKPLRDSPWSKTFGQRPSREMLNALGNLALLNRRINEAAANKSFSDKKRIIFRVSRQRFYETSKDVRGYEEWTPDIIKKRTSEMVSILAEAWELR